ncbi:MAG: hypothetical protein JSW12_04340 [Deltaproteobacteria bacterium]|nr:MAG: hypothetical protein JSW12_04340 [Deltaproteobacteria bacterium]
MLEQISRLNPPFSGSIPIYIAIGVFLLGVVLLIWFVYKRVSRLINLVRRRPVEHVRMVSSTLRLLLILLVIAVSAATVFLFAFLQSYTAFTHLERIGTVYCTPVPDSENDMILRLVMAESSTGGRIREYRVLGEQWVIEGHILKWDNWLNFLGVPTMYKLTRVRGRYLKAEDEASMPSTAYSLVPNEEDPFWVWLYQYGAHLPFVKAVYGNAAFTFPSTSKVFYLNATISGFMIQEK